MHHTHLHTESKINTYQVPNVSKRLGMVIILKENVAFNPFQACLLIIIQILIILFTLYNLNLAYIVHIKPLQ